MPPRRRRAAGPRAANGFDLLDSLIATGARSLVNAAAAKMGAATAALTPGAAMFDELAQDDEAEGPHRCMQPMDDGAPCHEGTAKICFSCRTPFCHEHVEFYNDENWAICQRCMHLMVSSVQRVFRAGARRAAAVAARARAATAAPPARPANAARLPWDVLGVLPTADGKDILRAYRKLALELHPDRNPTASDAAARWQEATEAYNSMKAALPS